MTKAQFPPFSRVRSSILPRLERSVGSFPEQRLVIEPTHDLVSMLHAFMSRLHTSLKRSWGGLYVLPQWQAFRRVDPWGCVHRPSCEHGPASVDGVDVEV